MTKRPAHATDCPGCNIGCVSGELLCPRCMNAVHAAQPTYYDAWMSARAVLDQRKEDTAAAASEAFRRGLIVGTAIVLHRPCSNRRNWHYQITAKGHALLDGKQPPARS